MSALKRLFPAPLMSAALLGMWLTLARSTSVGQILLGAALGLIVPVATAALRPRAVHARKPLVIARYILVVGYDVITSNFEVAWGVLAWRLQRPRPRFVTVPLDLRDPVGLAALSIVTTVVPGTVWSELALDRSALLLHVWNVVDEPVFVNRFKARYEAPLMEIFE